MRPAFLLLVVLSLVLLRASPVRAGEDVWGLPQLLGALAEVRASSGRFEERRSSVLLTTPLHASGTLRYTAPDRLEKRTLLPTPGRFLLEGDRLTVEQPGEPSRVLSLRQTPELVAFVDSIRATLAGDGTALGRVHNVSMQGTRRDWVLTLQPRDSRLREMVSALRIAGQGGTVLRIETQEGSGDASVITITPDP